METPERLCYDLTIKSTARFFITDKECQLWLRKYPNCRRTNLSKDWYESEKKIILDAVNAEDVVRMNHIGSSAVEGVIAKPTIDMLLEIDGRCNVTRLVDALKAIGYGEAIFIRWDDPMKLLLGKGYSIDGYEEKVFHLHVRYLGNWDELYFRDYLIAHPDVAAEYGKLKENILSDIESGKIRRIVDGRPNGYSEAKLKFVEKYSKAAKEEFRNCYSPRAILSPSADSTGKY